jgi:predicted enzyme related to lactoylglutathione lyase
MISGAHLIIGSEDADADRAFLRHVLGLDSVDAGGGWLIFGLPPAEVAVHPGKAGHQQLFLITDDLDAMLDKLTAAGVSIKEPVSEQSWGTVATFLLPGGSEVGIYKPKHPRPR